MLSEVRIIALAAFLSAVCALVATPAARADLGFGALGISADSLISSDVVKSLVSLIAFGGQHRPYEPATPLGMAVGLDFSLELTLFKIPDDLFANLSSVGAPSKSPIPAAPMPKLHLHKGMGEFVDLGGSILYYPSNWIVGGDIKVVLVQGEEGPTYAIRFCYTYTSVSFDGITASTKVYSPQFLLSRQMEFADPYIGVALEYATGEVNASVPGEKFLPSGVTLPPGVTLPAVQFSATAPAVYGAYAFGGVSLRIPRSGLRLTLEGSYNTAGESTMGTKVGFTF